jgi:uncharacterized protein YndB with AHSA1/START domain
MRLANVTIDIEAAPNVVFDLFTTETGLTRWDGRRGLDRPASRGTWRWVHDTGHTSSGEYLEIDPPERLTFTYGWESGALAEIAPESTRVDVTLDPVGESTRVTIVHAGLPTEVADRHAVGWAYFRGVLADVASGWIAPSVNRPSLD